jgi:hypothetical protein
MASSVIKFIVLLLSRHKRRQIRDLENIKTGTSTQFDYDSARIRGNAQLFYDSVSIVLAEV